MGVPGLIGDIQPFATLREGPITTVYKGFQRSLDRVVLLKVLKPTFSQDEDLVERFEAEARLVAKIQHPSVVAVYAYGRDDDQAYLATEYVDGQDLRQLIGNTGPLPVELAVYVTQQAARGLYAAHSRDVLHRDLKPSNLLVAQDGHVKLADFGMASLAGAVSEGGELRGTPNYLAPELITGEPPTPQADLFALGATLYEMLAGRRAFTGETTEEVLHAVLHHDPISVLDLHAPVPSRLGAVCARLLAKDPAERYADAEAVVVDLEVFRDVTHQRPAEAALQAFVDDPDGYRARAEMPEVPDVETNGHAPAVEARPDREPVERPVDRSRWSVVALVAAALVIVVPLVYGLWSVQQDPSTVASERSTSPDGVMLEDIAVTPSWPRFDSAFAAAQVERDPVAPDASPPYALSDTTGSLFLSVVPWAAVYVNGDSVGETPLEMQLPAGLHSLELRNPRFPPYRDEVIVTDAQSDTMNISLWSRVGRLFIEASPWAVVSINGVVRDTTPLDHPFVVAPGRTRLMLHHPQFGDWHTTINVGAGTEDTLQFNLQELLGP